MYQGDEPAPIVEEHEPSVQTPTSENSQNVQGPTTSGEVRDGRAHQNLQPDLEHVEVEKPASPKISPLGPCAPGGVQPDAVASISGTAYTIDLPPDVILDLVDTFFMKVQVWLPIFHQPRFYKRYIVPNGDSIQPLVGLSIEEALIFHCIFALSARFSDHIYFKDMTIEDRIRRFGEHSETLYHRARAIEVPTLQYLQGCILYSFYYYTNVPNSRGWLLAGVVLRLAFDLELNRIDEDGGQGLTNEQWVYREERRRAWWLVWEIDAFGSTLFSRPYGIDMREVSVLLPVSDETWFAEIPVASVLLDPRPTVAWKVLQGSENQDERAWFLVGNYLMTLAHTLPRRTRGFLSQELQELGAVLTCFRLCLPQHFHLETGFIFDSKSFVKNNWIISTHVITLGPRVLNGNLVIPPDADGLIHIESTRTSLQLRIFAQELCQLVNRWPVEFMPLCHPFIAGTLTGPANLHSCISQNEWIDPLVEMGHTVGKLVLRQFAEYWRVGKVFLRKSRSLPRRLPVKIPC